MHMGMSSLREQPGHVQLGGIVSRDGAVSVDVIPAQPEGSQPTPSAQGPPQPSPTVHRQIPNGSVKASDYGPDPSLRCAIQSNKQIRAELEPTQVW